MPEQVHPVYKQIDTLHNLLGQLEDKTALIATPHNTGVGVESTTSIPSVLKSASPIENELDLIITRIQLLINRI